MDPCRRDAILHTNSDLTVLVECKHHRNPIRREMVQVLDSKLTSARAQKGMLFSTARFQQGALYYASSRRIALVHFTQGGPVYETRGRDGCQGPDRPYAAYWATITDAGGMSYRSVGDLHELLFCSTAE